MTIIVYFQFCHYALFPAKLHQKILRYCNRLFLASKTLQDCLIM